MSLLLLNEDELRQTINLSEALSAVEKGLIASAEGRLNFPGSFSLNLPDIEGNVEVRGAYLQDAPYYVIEMGSYFQSNPSINLPVNSGLIVVFDAATGFPAAFLLDNGYLADVQSGMVGALTAKYLKAHDQPQNVAVIGTDGQAYLQLKALIAATDINLVSVWGRTPLEADTYGRRIVEDHDVHLEIADSVEEALTHAEIVLVAGSGEIPPLEASWIQPGAHLTVIGSSPSRQRLAADLMRRVDVIIVDDYEHCTARGETSYGLVRGLIGETTLQGELSSLILGKIPGRTRPDQITLADLVGLDWLDAIIAALAVDKALFLGLGQRLEMGRTTIGQRIENLP